jgi:hypothetical protein
VAQTIAKALAVEKTIAIEMAETEPGIATIQLVIAQSVLGRERAPTKMAYRPIHPPTRLFYLLALYSLSRHCFLTSLGPCLKQELCQEKKPPTLVIFQLSSQK